jgi:trimeric autotransporter adhesin
LSDFGIIDTVAGDGGCAFFGDGGQATSTLLRNPHGIVVDKSGNLYLVDKYAHGSHIRMVTKSNGIISTVVGNGTEGYSGDGGPATSARLNQPNGVALDASGNIYIADSANHCIRMVTKTTGIITILAGGNIYAGQYDGDGVPATSARFRYPTSVFVDASGNIYIADSQNHRIRMVTKSTGIISTVAGSHPDTGERPDHCGDGGPATSGVLHSPIGVFVDRPGNIYIADTGDNHIRIVTKSTVIISSVAGAGSYGHVGNSGDGGPATSAKLKCPSSVFVDASGNVYISDSRNNRICMVTKSTGIISTVAGDGTSDYVGEGGLAKSA